MPPNDQDVFDAIINYESRGSGDVLSDADKIDAAIKNIDTTLSFEVTADTATAKSDLLALDGLIDESQAVNVTADTTSAKSDLGGIQQQLENLQGLAIISLVLDAAQFISSFESLPIVSFFAETDAALARVKSRTGTAIAGLDEVINRIYVETGAEKATIADALASLIQNGETSLPVLEEMGTRAVEFSQVWEEDVNRSIATANQLIGTGLADNASEAFDILNYGMQSGANRAGDFLDLVGEFGADFSRLGLTGQQMVDLTNASLDAGAQNAGRYGEAINGLAQNFDTMGEETSAIVEETGIDPDNLGIDGLTTLIEHLQSIEEQAERTAAVTATFGSGGTEIGEALTFVLPDPEETSESIEGTADAVSTALNDSLSEVFREAGATLEVELIEAFDNAFNITERLQTFKDQVIGFSDDIQAGMGLGEALEVNFGLQGADDFITRFESTMGNVVIAILELVAGVRDLQGLGSEGIRAEITRLASPQLAFDLGAVSPEEMVDVLETGIGRGLEGEALQAALSTAVSEALAAGEAERAQAIVDAAANLPMITTGGGLFGHSIGATPQVETEGLQEQVDAAIAREAIEVPVHLTYERTEDRDPSEVLPTFQDVAPTADLVSDFNALAARVDVAEQLLDARARIGEGLGAMERPGEQIGEISATAVEDAATAAALVETGFANTLALMTQAAEGESFDIDAAMQTIEDSVTAMGDTTYSVIQGNTVTEDFEAMAASALMNSLVVVSSMDDIEGALEDVGVGFSVFAVRATTSIRQVAGEVQALLQWGASLNALLVGIQAGHATINNVANSVNVNQTNFNQSGAQVAGANTQLLDQISGATP